MRTRAAIFLLLFASWCVVCWMYWQKAVAVVPTWSIPLNSRQVEFIGDARDAVVIKSTDEQQVLKEPIEIVIPGETFQSRRALRAGDQLLRVLRSDGSRAAIRREGTLGVVDLATDSFVPIALESTATTRAWFAAGGKVLIAQSERGLHAFDALNGNPLWERRSAALTIDPDQSSPADVTTFVSVTPVTGFFLQPDPSRVRPVNVFTGLEPEWLRQLTSIRTAIASPCGRYIFVGVAAREGTMHDATTGAVLWVTEGRLGPLAVEGVGFSEDGQELTGRLVLGSQVTEARWKASTGEVLQAPPLGARGLGNLHETRARYRLGFSRPGLIEHWVDWAAKMLGTTRPRPKLYAIFESGRDDSLGMITTSIDDIPDRYPSRWVSGEDRILVQMRRTLNYYSIPPQRDWAKLALWCIVPTAAVAFALAVVQQVRSHPKPLAEGRPEAAQPSATL